jgi:hypothetical protein
MGLKQRLRVRFRRGARPIAKLWKKYKPLRRALNFARDNKGKIIITAATIAAAAALYKISPDVAKVMLVHQQLRESMSLPEGDWPGENYPGEIDGYYPGVIDIPDATEWVSEGRTRKRTRQVSQELMNFDRHRLRPPRSAIEDSPYTPLFGSSPWAYADAPRSGEVVFLGTPRKKRSRYEITESLRRRANSDYWNERAAYLRASRERTRQRNFSKPRPTPTSLRRSTRPRFTPNRLTYTKFGG